MGASNIKGITIEINGDTTKLSKALRDVDKSLKDTQKSLRDVDKLLKLDPKNTELLTQKQKLLKDAISDTKDRLQQLKDAQSGVSKGTAEWDGLQREIIETEQKLKGLEDQYRQFGSVAAQQVQAVGNQMQEIGGKITDAGKTMTTKVTLPLAAVGTAGALAFAEVDKTMQLTNATMGNTEEQAKLLSDAMKDAAANSIFGMSDAATATLNFARAGLDAEQAAAALAPAMNLAAGEGGNLDTVSAGLVATINGFGDSFDETSHYADVFAAACNNSALDVDTLSGAMSVAAPIFSSSGKSVEDAALMMGVMANAGIDANTAANSLKTGMARLASPTKQATDAMADYGIKMEDIWNKDGTMKDVTEIQANLNESFGKLSEQEQLAAASAIFGKNNMSSWLALINTAPEDVQKLNDSIQNCTGTTDEMSEAMMSGFGGSLESLKSSIDVAAVSIGEALAPAISKVVEWIQKAVDWFNSLDENQKSIIATIGLVVAAIGPVLVIIGTLISTIGTIVAAIGGALAVISGVGPILALVVAAIATVIAAGVALYQNWDTIKANCQQFVADVKAKWEDLKTQVTEKVENLKKAAAEKFEGIKKDVTDKIEGAKKAAVDKFNEIKTKITEAITAAKNTVSTKASEIKTTIETNVNNAVKTLKDLPSKALQWGKDLIKNFVDGIKAKWDALKDSILDIADTVADFIGFSEPKKGPLSKFHTFAPDMLELYAQGIRENMHLVTDQMNTLANSMAVSVQRPASIYLTNNTVLNGRTIASDINRELGFLL